MLRPLCFAKWDRYFNFSGQHGSAMPRDGLWREAPCAGPGGGVFGSFGVGMGFTRRAVIVASAPGRFFPE